MSRMTRDDMAEMRRCNSRPAVVLSTKREEQAEIDRQKEVFFANGGRIQVIPTGVSGDSTEQVRAFQASKGGKAHGMRLKGTLGVEKAAAYLGVPQKAFSELVAAGLGPAPCTQGKLHRWVPADLDAWMAGKGAAA